MRGADALGDHKAPSRACIFERGGERVLGRQPVTDGERAHASRPTRFGDHAPMAADRSRAVAPAMKEHQNPGRIAAGRERPFGWYSPCVDR